MKKKHLILLFLVVIWGMVAGSSKVSAQDFGTPNYFIKDGDTLKSRTGLILKADASYTKAQSESKFLHSADSLKYVFTRDSLTKYATPASVNNLVGDTAYIGHTNQAEPITGDWSFTGSPSYKTFKTTPVTITNDTLFATTGSVFTKTLSASTTFKLSGLVDGQMVTLAVTNTASNYTVEWSALGGLILLWSGGTAPTQTIGAKTDIYSFQRIGKNIYGAAIQNF